MKQRFALRLEQFSMDSNAFLEKLLRGGTFEIEVANDWSGDQWVFGKEKFSASLMGVIAHPDQGRVELKIQVVYSGHNPGDLVAGVYTLSLNQLKQAAVPLGMFRSKE